MKMTPAEDDLDVSCRVFCEHTDSLFLPAYLLTGSLTSAESCLISGVEMLARQLPSDRRYLYTVARRCVIKAAIEVISPVIHNDGKEYTQGDGDGLQRDESRPRNETDSAWTLIEALDRTLRSMPALQRVALVLRVFEGYSRRDASLLLGLSMATVEQASKEGFLRFAQCRYRNELISGEQ
jgi:DNA-directed RNA polymerase specialized sigma24 family protein